MKHKQNIEKKNKKTQLLAVCKIKTHNDTNNRIDNR